MREALTTADSWKWLAPPRLGMRLLIAAVGPGLVLLVWFLAHQTAAVNPTLLPNPFGVLSRLGAMLFSGQFWFDVAATLTRTLGGLAIATIVGVTIGLAVGSWRPLEQMVGWSVDFFRSLPVVTLYPAVVLVVGLGNPAKLLMIFTACVFVIAMNSAYGVIQSSPIRRKMAQLLGGSRMQVFLLVRFFDALPQTMIGIRTSLSYALIVCMLTEMFMGGFWGIGVRLMEAESTLRYTQMYALILVAGLMGYLLNRGFVLLENYIVHWKGR